MKKLLSLLVLIMLIGIAYGQENMLTLSYGYPIANVENVDKNGTGWRITGLYEFNPMGGNVAHGFSFGYASVSGDANISATYEANSIPLYYAPKFLFGNEKVNGFIKGALGWQFSKLKTEGQGLVGGSLEDDDSGFTGGAGAGAMYLIKENIFLNLEYEFLWMSNSYYRDESLNTVSLGLGYRF